MADTFRLTILTPERKLVDQLAVRSVLLPGSEGQVEILPGYTRFVGTLVAGPFQVETARGDISHSGVISSGFFETENDLLTVVAETLELRHEIDVTRAKAAEQKAASALSEADIDEANWRKYQLKLERALIRQQNAKAADSSASN